MSQQGMMKIENTAVYHLKLTQLRKSSLMITNGNIVKPSLKYLQQWQICKYSTVYLIQLNLNQLLKMKQI